MKHSTNPAATGVMSLAVSAACVLECLGGGATAAGVNPDTVNPCNLITQTEAQFAVAMPVKPGVFVDSVWRICNFKPANGGTYYVNVSLSTMDKAGFDDAPPDKFERAGGTNLDAYFPKTTRNCMSGTPAIKW